MKVPLLDIAAQIKPLENELKDALLDVIDSGSFIMGQQVSELEKKISEYLEVPYCIGVSSGTDALLVALMALDIGHGDIVITTAYSFFATAGVISRTGARPIFVDIDPDTYNIAPQCLQTTLNNLGKDIKRVKAIIPVHLYGQSANMGPLLDIANKYDLPLIEDAAQAIGTRLKIDSEVCFAGTIGLMGCLSFFPSKNLGGIGDGGMVITKDEKVAEKIRKLRVHGSYPKYFHSLVGGNFRLDTVQAAALLVKLPHLKNWHAMRQENAAYYDENLCIKQVKTPVLHCDREHHIYNQYVISVENKRDELQKFLSEHNIGTAIYYPVPFHMQECFASLEYGKGSFPQSEYAANHTLALPIYPELTREQQDYVIEKIGAFYG